jgi:hypothetical protein
MTILLKFWWLSADRSSKRYKPVKKYGILASTLMVFLSLGFSLKSEAACRVTGGIVLPQKVHRGLYLSLYTTNSGQLILNPPLSRILGNTTSENVALSFFIKYQIDSLSLYNLPAILSNSTQSSQLSSFIQAARACGVAEVNAIGAMNSDWVQIRNYQNSYPGKFDGLLTEVEFWNASSVTTAFSSFISQLQYMRALGITNYGVPLRIGAYLGWLNNTPSLTEAQVAAQIASNLDFVFLHSYVKSPTTAYGYAQSRINALRAAKPSLPIRAIYSAEGTTYNSGGGNIFMGDWLATNSLDSAEAIYGASYIPAGFQYFEYSFLKLYLP